MPEVQKLVPIEEQISQELVSHNVTEAVIASLKEKYGHLKIAGIEDRETYDLVKTGRKECKAYRVLAKKICEKGREDAVAIQKAWVGKQKEVIDQIAAIEDPLEEQEKAYESAVAKEKEDRKRRQEEQLINRQQTLSAMGVLYNEGCFTIGEVSFELSVVKESEQDIWEESILPKFKEEYEKVEAERIEQERAKQEREAEMKRQQEELEQKQRELYERESALKKAQEEQERKQNEEAQRKEADAKAAREMKIKSRMDYLIWLGLTFDFTDDHFRGFECFVPMLDIKCHNDDQWSKLVDGVTAQVERKKAEIHQRNELQTIRLNELLPYNKYGADVDMLTLGWLGEDEYQSIFNKKKRQFEKEQEDERVRALGQTRLKSLKDLGYVPLTTTAITLSDLSEEDYDSFYNDCKNEYEAAKKAQWEKEQEEKRKQEELLQQQKMDQAKDKEKWNDMIYQINQISVHEMRSSQYRKKAMILREKLEEIKAL